MNTKQMDGMDFINRVLSNVNTLTSDQMQEMQFVMAEALSGIVLTVQTTSLSTEHDDNQESFKAFFATKRSKGCTDGTLYQYTMSIRRLFTFCDKNFRDIGPVDIVNFINYLRVCRLNPTSVCNNIRNLSSYFSFLKRYGYITINPVEVIDIPKAPEIRREPIRKEDIVKLKDHSGLRNEAIIDTLRTSGIRVSELVGLDIKDVDMINDRLLIKRGKGGESRIAIISTEAKVHIMRYLATREDDCPALFVSVRKPYRRLKACGVRSMLKSVAKEAGVQSNVFPHRFRHTMCTEAAERGLQDSAIQQLAGHKNIGTTMIYTHKRLDTIQMQYKAALG